MKAEYRRLHKVLFTSLAELPDVELRNINVAQNVMRDVVSAVLDEMMPYSHKTPVEMARRLASYALSSVPLEDQEIVVAELLRTFADFHMNRTASGAIIEAHWRMEDGTDKLNFPKEAK